MENRSLNDTIRLLLSNEIDLLHRHFERALDELKAYLLTAGSDEIFLVVGPSGGCKSTLLNVLPEHLLGKDRDKNDDAYVLLRAEHPSRGSFDWGGFANDGLSAICDPFEGRSRRSLDADGGRALHLPSGHRMGVGERLRLLDRALLSRRTRYLAIDEGQDILERLEGDETYRQLSTLKARLRSQRYPLLSIIVAGTYSLLAAADRNDQLIRRITTIHLAPYSDRTEEERSAFRDLLASYDDLVAPFTEENLLVSNENDVMKLCAGTPGLVTRNLAGALRRKLVSGHRRASFRDFVACSLTDIQLEKFQQAITLGTDVLSGRAPSSSLLALKRRGSKTPGRRNPSRDPVGGLS